MNSIFVYCYLVQPPVVGDANVPLLRALPIEGKMGDLVTQTYTNIQYIRVQRKPFEEVKILLKYDTFNPVPFERGKVLAILHFRQENLLYFA